MRKKNLLFLTLLGILTAGNASAGWQYPGTYVGDGWYQDDGSRFVISARGGASFGMGTVKNKVGAIVTDYYVNSDMTMLAPSSQFIEERGDEIELVVPDGWYHAGYASLDSLPATKNLESFAFTAGVSLGVTMPNRPQWRIEAGWDQITESNYNSSPMFSGEVELVGSVDAAYGNLVAGLQSGSVDSQLTTDVFSIMAYYDFFDGLHKPMNKLVPYVGLGIGYASTDTILNMSDPFGDIAVQQDLAQYGEIINNMILFYRSKYSSVNVASILSLGASYGISEQVFFDFGLRMMYLPEIKWALSNQDNTKHREMFSSENNIYINAVIGIRFEF